MDDQVAVRVADGLADLEEEVDALVDGQPVLLAVRGEGRSFDELHHKEGRAVLRGAGVEEAGDAGMLEATEDALFGQEAAQAVGRGEALAQHLHGNGRPQVVALCAVHHPHAAAPDFVGDAVRADLLSRDRPCRRHALCPARVRAEKRIVYFVCFQKKQDLSDQRVIGAAGVADEGGSVLGRLVEGVVKDAEYSVPALGGQGHVAGRRRPGRGGVGHGERGGGMDGWRGNGRGEAVDAWGLWTLWTLRKHR